MKRIAFITLIVITAVTLILGFGLVVQSRMQSARFAQYVALGSSTPAGYGLGSREPGSPLVCMRSMGGFPNLLAKRLNLSLVNVSCSGATTDNIIHGGPLFQRPQLAAIGPQTQLVTITAGANDVNSVLDLIFASGHAFPIARVFWKGLQPVDSRNYSQVGNNLRLIVDYVRNTAPRAQIVIVTHLTAVPTQGSCDQLGIDAKTAELNRKVTERLNQATRDAARQSGSLFVDMDSIGRGHDACSSDPWINGASTKEGAMFHPNAKGAQAMADSVFVGLSHATSASADHR